MGSTNASGMAISAVKAVVGFVSGALCVDQNFTGNLSLCKICFFQTKLAFFLVSCGPMCNENAVDTHIAL